MPWARRCRHLCHTTPRKTVCPATPCRRWPATTTATSGWEHGTACHDLTATTSTTTTGTGTEDTTVTDNGTHTSEHRKHGNIGVLENQSMLQSEVDFWKWSFIDQVCKDICDLIALSIY